MTETKEENTLFPGRSNYTGPRSGYFGLLHHQELFETSHDVIERVNYIQETKPVSEVPTRLHNIIYLGGCAATEVHRREFKDYEDRQAIIYQDYKGKRDALINERNVKLSDINDMEIRQGIGYEFNSIFDDLYKRYNTEKEALQNEYMAKHKIIDAEILAYIKERIPDCAWDEDRRTLVFPS